MRLVQGGAEQGLRGPAHDLLRFVRVESALTAIGYTAASLALLRMSNDEFDLPPLGAAANS